MLSSIWKFNLLTNEWKLVSDVSGDEIGYTDMVQSQAVIYSVCGLGVAESFNSVFYIDLSQSSPGRRVLSDNWDSPPKRKNHCSFVVNQHILIFGGVDESGIYYNDLWYFDLASYTWNYVVTSGNTPAARELAGCASYGGNSFLIFGGRDSTNIFNDIFYFDCYRNYWINPGPATAPSVRYSSCLTVYEGAVYILGGQDDMSIFDEIWIYNYLYNSFYLINSNDKVRIELVNYDCWVDGETTTSLYVLGGINSSSQSSSALYQIIIIQNGGGYATSTRLVYETHIPVPSESAMVQDGGFIYVIFGSYWKKTAVPLILILNYKTFEEYYLELESEFALYGHTAVHYGDSLYVIGGSSTIAGIELGFIENNRFYRLKRSTSDLVYLGCSAGTLEPDCTACPAGTIYQDSQCVSCPPGRFSTSVASTSLNQCIPCAYGSYNSEGGRTYCVDCPTTGYCPIGSTTPMQRTDISQYQVIQPPAYVQNTSEISGIVSEMWYGAIGTFGIVIGFAITHKKFSRKIKKIDIFSTQHNQQLNVPVMYRKTRIGGIFSVFFILAAGIIVGGAFMTYFQDNISETKSLVPILLLENSISASSLTVVVSFYVYGGGCVTNSQCSSYNIFSDSGLTYSSRTISCSQSSSTCTVSISYTGFSLPSDSTISLQMLEPLASATSISVNLTSISSIPKAESSVFLPVSTGSDLLLFLGTKPTVVTYELTPSVTDIQVFFSQSDNWPSLATGYHVSVNKNVQLGTLHDQQR